MLQVPVAVSLWFSKAFPDRSTITHSNGLNEWIQYNLMTQPSLFKPLSVDLAADIQLESCHLFCCFLFFGYGFFVHISSLWLSLNAIKPLDPRLSVPSATLNHHREKTIFMS